MNKKLKLSNFSNERFDKEELNGVKGGDVADCPRTCCCGCQYANQGGSSENANYWANQAGQLWSSGCYEEETD